MCDGDGDGIGEDMAIGMGPTHAGDGFMEMVSHVMS